MDSRFVKIPVLSPTVQDLPAIVVATARRVDPNMAVPPTDASIQEAASIFHGKGANPRDIRGALSNARMFTGSLTGETVLLAAHDLCMSTDMVTRNLCDLWAIKKCSSRSFFPWADDPRTYPYPEHLEGIVDAATGAIHADELEKRIRELQPHANV